MIAHAGAGQQAGFPMGRQYRFFSRQARQELHHAKVFNRVVLCITPRGGGPVPACLQQFGSRLEHACQRRDLPETLVGQQIVLEGFGALILQRMNVRFDQRRIGFKRARKVLLYQELGHQAFGERMVRAMVESEAVRLERVHELASEYLVLIDRVLADLQPMFDVVGADAELYKLALRKGLPGWVTSLP